MEPKEINTFFFFQYVTFPLFPYYKSRKLNIKAKKIMTYIIQNRIVRICYNDRDFSEQLKELFLPSMRNEHRQPITLIRL